MAETKRNDAEVLDEILKREAPRRQALIARLVELLTPKEPPRILYHYTSPTAFLEIAKTKVLWASHARFLNDKLEFAFALQRMSERLHARSKTSSAAEGSRLERLDRIVAHAGSFDPYVVSFSQDGDTLSQWRAYCPTGGGYAVGLEAERLRQEATRQRFLLLRCEYGEQEQDRILDELITSMVAFLEDADKRGAYPKEYIPSLEEAVLGVQLAVAAPTMKHPSFKEEAEWRAVWLPAYDPAFKDIRYRGGRYTLIPYREFSIAASGDPPPVMDVVIGPTPYPDASEEALRNFLPTAGIHPAVIRKSGTPFREW